MSELPQPDRELLGKEREAPGRLREPAASETHDGRFAPSPTGPLHLGNLRTALLAWLFARSAGARFLVRLEDLDRDRVRPGSEEQQLADLRALGLDWDGPVVRQSERIELYGHAIETLSGEGFLYPCYCSRKEIREAASAPHGKAAEGVYPGTCRELTRAERYDRERSGRPAALRLNASGAIRIAFEDRLHGQRSGVVDDFVVRRSDGVPAYNLAVIVDDAAQGIGEVVRGADLAETTPRQILVARLLKIRPPVYAHVPLMLGDDDGARLAKRHGAVTLAQRQELGESPRDVLGTMAASVGLAEPGERPTIAELLRRFDPSRLVGASAGAGEAAHSGS